MAGETISPNMNLILPGVGETEGPDYAIDLNNSLLIIDQHDHSQGQGVPITPDGISITGDLTFSNYDATNLKSVQFYDQSIAVTDLGSLYELDGDLYYRDASSNNVRITESGGVAGSPGSISNLVSPASASYVALNSTFVWQSDVNTPAIMDGASIILRNLSAGSYGLTLEPPAAMAADLTLVLPNPPVSGSRFVSLASTGVLGASWNVDNSTIEISSNTVQVKAAGITGTQVTSNINLPGNTVQENGKNVIVSSTNATTSLKIIRGWTQDSGILAGEGFSFSRVSTGKYQMNFSSAFSDIPVCTATPWVNSQVAGIVTTGPGAINSSFVQIQLTNLSGVAEDGNVFFIVIGQR